MKKKIVLLFVSIFAVLISRGGEPHLSERHFRGAVNSFFGEEKKAPELGELGMEEGGALSYKRRHQDNPNVYTQLNVGNPKSKNKSVGLSIGLNF